MFNSKKKTHEGKMYESAIELKIATVQLATAKTELETAKIAAENDNGKYTDDDVKDMLVDFGNYLLSEKRAETIDNEENRKNVTDADLRNWADEIDQCDCPVCQMLRMGI